MDLAGWSGLICAEVHSAKQDTFRHLEFIFFITRSVIPAHLVAPVVTTTSTILSSNKIQNGDILHTMETFWYRLTEVVLENGRNMRVVIVVP